MNHQRREFLKWSGGLALGSAIAPLANGWLNFQKTNKKVKEFGIQLYGLRDILGKNPKSVLDKLPSFGYKQIELFEHSKLGIFLGMSNKELKKYVTDLGMKIPSVHSNIYIDFEKKVEAAAAIDIKYFIYNWEGPGKKLDDYKKMADDFNKKAEFCKQHNIKFAFHNHDFTFKNMDGVMPQEWLLEHTDKNLVDFQVDLYWVITAGVDPVVHINKYPDRYKLCHFKDRSKGATDREGTAICELGTGTIDFPFIMKAIRKSAIKYYTVDQDTCNDRNDPLACARTDAEYMKKIKI